MAIPATTRAFRRRFRAAALAAACLWLWSGHAAAQSDAWRGGYAIIDPASEQAVRIADNILSWQLPHGGWSKEINFAERPWTPGTPKSVQVHRGVELGSFDDGKTIAELRLLALVHNATGEERFREGFMRGLDFVLAAQYPSGGWPQAYPERGNYSDFVTFNDDAMVNVMSFIKEILDGSALYAFVDEDCRGRLAEAFDRGIDFILKAQIEANGRLTAWGQQHHPVTYQAVWGRPYEHPSISAAESAPIVRLLMSLPDPSPEVRSAILHALEWLEAARLPDGRWARMYEIGTNRPIFSGRDGVVRYNIQEIEAERRDGYAWYGRWPESLLSEVYRTGYIDELFESLPDHPAPRIRFLGPLSAPSPTVRGLLEIGVEVAAAPSRRLAEVRIELDGQELYRGAQGPAPGSLVIDTSQFEDGLHTLRVTAEEAAYGSISRSVQLRFENWWNLVEELRPPISGGFFGEIDTLQAVERSGNWAYTGENPDDFFGDPHRKLRTGADDAWLVWETPGLLEAAAVLYVRAGFREEWVRFEVSADGEEWRPLPFESETAGTSAAGWSRLNLTASAPAGPPTERFRLTLAAAAPADAVQLGEVALRGRRQPD